MKHNILKCLAVFSIALAIILTINTAYALTPDGKMVNPTISTKRVIVQGGSIFTANWPVPYFSRFNVWVEVPSGSTASNALYHIYPKGNSVANTMCSSTDATYPCFEANINQTTAIDGWVQLTLGNDINTNWVFKKSGYVNVSANTISNSELLGVAQISFVDVAPTAPLAIGQTYQGGIIFYLDSTKNHGLIAAPTDQSAGVSWSEDFSFTGATGTAIGTGQANTNAIIKTQGKLGRAAILCDDFVYSTYSDWYLPSKDELFELYKYLRSVRGLADGYYWSSSEGLGGNARAWAQPSSSNIRYLYPKRNTYKVRAVRAF